MNLSRRQILTSTLALAGVGAVATTPTVWRVYLPHKWPPILGGVALKPEITQAKLDEIYRLLTTQSLGEERYSPVRAWGKHNVYELQPGDELKP